MRPGIKKDIIKSIRRMQHKFFGLDIRLIWIDIRYGVEEWVLLKTWRFRLKHSKRLQLSSMAYHGAQMGWDDVDVADQWGRWLPLGFGICSQKNWEFDNEVNKRIGEPEEPWQEVSGGDNWKTYWFHEDYLDSRHYFNAARRHLKDKLSDAFYDKELELRIFVQSQKSLDEETKQYLEWVGNGSKPLKVEFTDNAKDDMKKILGDDGADQLFKDIDERNKDIDDKKE